MTATNWELRATALEMLAFSLRYPGQDLVEAVSSGEWADAALEIVAALEVVLPDGFPKEDLMCNKEGQSAPDAETLLHVLRAEATRLFVGTPEAMVSPYEGIWRAADDGVQGLLFVNPHSMNVERFLKSCGLGQPAGTNEPLDHVATELEFLQYLASLEAGIATPPEGAIATECLPGGSAAAAYAQFMEEHVQTWMLRFAEAMQSESRIPFYRAAGQLLSVLLPVL